MAHTRQVIGNDGRIHTAVRMTYSKEECRKQHQQSRGQLAGLYMPEVKKMPREKGKLLSSPLLYIIIFAVLLVLSYWSLSHLAVGSSSPVTKKVSAADVIVPQAQSAAQVAMAFAKETDANKRLKYVLDPEVSKNKLASYPEQALNHPVEKLTPIGYSELEGRAVSSFSAKFADGTYRMLSVVNSDNGLKVDWDCYARHCSASWQDLFAGKKRSAEVRVFVQPGDYHVGQFRDPSEWTCFLLNTPDCERIIYAYARAGSAMSKQMQAAVMKNRSLRQHMTLQISSQNDSGKDRLFVIDDLLAMGWVVATK